MVLKELDVIKLKKDFENKRLKKGAIGTIVNIFRNPNVAYEIEFVDKNGKTILLDVFLIDDIEKL